MARLQPVKIADASDFNPSVQSIIQGGVFKAQRKKDIASSIREAFGGLADAVTDNRNFKEQKRQFGEKLELNKFEANLRRHGLLLEGKRIDEAARQFGIKEDRLNAAADFKREIFNLTGGGASDVGGLRTIYKNIAAHEATAGALQAKLGVATGSPDGLENGVNRAVQGVEVGQRLKPLPGGETEVAVGELNVSNLGPVPLAAVDDALVVARGAVESDLRVAREQAKTAGKLVDNANKAQLIGGGKDWRAIADATSVFRQKAAQVQIQEGRMAHLKRNEKRVERRRNILKDAASEAARVATSARSAENTLVAAKAKVVREAAAKGEKIKEGEVLRRAAFEAAMPRMAAAFGSDMISERGKVVGKFGKGFRTRSSVDESADVQVDQTLVDTRVPQKVIDFAESQIATAKGKGPVAVNQAIESAVQYANTVADEQTKARVTRVAWRDKHLERQTDFMDSEFTDWAAKNRGRGAVNEVQNMNKSVDTKTDVRFSMETDLMWRRYFAWENAWRKNPPDPDVLEMMTPKEVGDMRDKRLAQWNLPPGLKPVDKPKKKKKGEESEDPERDF